MHSRTPWVRTSRAGAAAVLALTVAGCGSDGRGNGPPQVRVTVGAQQVSLQPTQYCDDGTGHRYDVKPPVVVAAPDVRVTFTVPAAVAQQGWAVQVFDQHLEQTIGTVRVDDGKAVFDGITTSDVVPEAFYLVVVEDEGKACSHLSGAWPVGVIRARPDQGSTAPSSTAPGSGSPGMPTG